MAVVGEMRHCGLFGLSFVGNWLVVLWLLSWVPIADADLGYSGFKLTIDFGFERLHVKRHGLCEEGISL